jgi:predicted metal-dependent peptidase
MSKITDRAARDKIVRARTNLLVSNGFFGFLTMMLKLVEAKEVGGQAIPTMAVDGVHLYYNPDFVHKLDERECEGVAAHEVMHCALKHFTRRGNRDPMIWNIAGDHVINNDLMEAGFKLPKPNCCDPKYKGMTTEEVYDDLMKDAVKIKISMGEGNSADPGGCGGVLDAPGDANQKEETANNWEVQVRTAVQVAAGQNAGQIPGTLRALIQDLNRPKVSWRDLTRRFIDQSMLKDFSWSRLHRRSVASGVLMPGLISDRLNKLVFFVDVSGSISYELAKEMVSEVAGALDQGTADCVVVAYADTAVLHADEYYQGDIVTCGHYRGGGTDFADSFRWLAANHPDASCVIYLTDLQVYNFGEDPGCPTMWAVYSPYSQFDALAGRVPFGTAIHVSESYG